MVHFEEQAKRIVTSPEWFRSDECGAQRMHQEFPPPSAIVERIKTDLSSWYIEMFLGRSQQRVILKSGSQFGKKSLENTALDFVLE